MKTDVVSLTKARKLLDELNQLEEARDVLGNYDAKSYALFTSVYNSNSKVPKEVRIPLPADVRKSSIDYINERIAEIKKQLAELYHYEGNT